MVFEQIDEKVSVPKGIGQMCLPFLGLIAVPVGSKTSNIFVGVGIGPDFFANTAHLQDRVVFFFHWRFLPRISVFIPVQQIVVLLRQFFSLRSDFSAPSGMGAITGAE